MIIIDCECGHGCPCGGSGKDVIYFSASSELGMFQALSQMQSDSLNENSYHLPGVVEKPSDVRVGFGKILTRTQCGCPEDWIVVWGEGKAKLMRNSGGSSVNYKSCKICGKLGVKIVDCICKHV